jgi:UDP:flavonoid glycosyltransferase YjiC (YdhE family)
VRALVDAGHDVRLSTGPDFETAVTRAGVRFVPLPDEALLDSARIDERFPHRAGLTGPRLVRHDLLHLFTEPAGAQAEHLLALHAAEPADALVGDTALVGSGLATEPAGPLSGSTGSLSSRTATPDRLGPILPNASIADFIPYGPLFRRADAVVTNGGFGGV